MFKNNKDVHQLVEIIINNKHKFLFSFLLFVFSLQIISVVATLSQHADNKSIIDTFSLDAGAGIDTASKTKIYNDNRWRPYGPLYYRLVKLTSYLNDSFHHPDQLDDKERYERKLSFFLMFCSFIFLILAGLTISYIFFKSSLILTLTSTIILNYIFLNNYEIVKLLITNHPDILLSLLSLLYGITLLKLLTKKNNFYIILISIISGLAFLTKLSFLYLYLPTILLSLIFYLVSIKQLIKIFIGTTLCYFIVGFPQSLFVFPVIEYLLYQRNMHISPDLDSVILNSSLFFKLFIQVFLSLLIMKLFLCNINFKNSFVINMTKNHLKIFIIFISPFLLAISTLNTLMPSVFYMIPILFFFIPSLALFEKNNDFFNTYVIRKSSDNFLKEINMKRIVIFGTFLFSISSIVPNNFVKYSDIFYGDRLAVRNMYYSLKSIDPKVNVFYSTPYFPEAFSTRSISPEQVVLNIMKNNDNDLSEIKIKNKQKNMHEVKKYIRDYQYSINKKIISFINDNSFVELLFGSDFVKLENLHRIFHTGYSMKNFSNQSNIYNYRYLCLAENWIFRFLKDEPSDYVLKYYSYDDWKILHNFYKLFIFLDDDNKMHFKNKVIINTQEYNLIHSVKGMAVYSSKIIR